jgi:hypothetical protein
MTTSSANPQTSNSLADLAARIRTVTGDDSESPFRSRLRRVRHAAQTCSSCARCGGAVPTGAPIWRSSQSLGYGPFGRWRYMRGPVCEQCVGPTARSRPARPCEHCQRSVHQPNDFRSHRRTFCCELCERAARATAARQQRSDARDTRPCEDCGEIFEPTRTDARFCSSPCRQRAYRKRRGGVTDDDCRCDITIVSRNAEAPLVSEGGRS